MKKLAIAGLFIGLFAIASIALFISLNNEKAEAIVIDPFENIPPKPDNLDLIKREVKTFNTRYDICTLPREAYLQPDFYDGWSIAEGEYNGSHDYTRWGVYGYGFYPAKDGIEVSNLKKGETINFCTYLVTGYTIETYQGMQLIGLANKYFDVKIDPSILLLEPTFPYFPKDWVRPINVEITAKQDIPVGEYVIDLIATSPDESINKEFYSRVLYLSEQDNAFYMQQCAKQMSYDKCKSLVDGRVNRYVIATTFTGGRIEFTGTIKVIA